MYACDSILFYHSGGLDIAHNITEFSIQLSSLHVAPCPCVCLSVRPSVLESRTSIVPILIRRELWDLTENADRPRISIFSVYIVKYAEP
jgi:hypothetical protein